MVSALFLDVCGFTALSERLDPEIVTDVLNRLFQRVEAAVQRYDGYLDKFIGDAALALFGAPRAHEDDAERAVRAALDVFATLPDLEREVEEALGLRLPLQLHASVGTGVVVAGVLGAGEAARYSALGDAVNVASRLLGEAGPGEILVGDATAARLRGRATLDLRGSFQLRGRNGPVEAWRVLSVHHDLELQRGVPGLESPLIGRDAELRGISEALERLMGGLGGLVTLEGLAGIGKTRLTREALRTASPGEQAPWSAVLGRCISFGSAIPFHPWSDIVARLLEEEALVDTLEARVGAEGRAYGLREALAPLTLEPLTLERGAVASLDQGGRRAVAIQALLALLEQAALTRPRALVLDDLQWADDSSRALLQQVLPLAARLPLLLVLVRRPEGGAEHEATLREEAARLGLPTLSLSLGPLSPSQSVRLVENLLGPGHELPPDATQRLVARSEGAPLFIEEQLRQLRDRGALRWEDDRWRFDPTRASQAEQELPPTLYALLAARIDRLDEPLRERLELASVLGAELSMADVDLHLGEDLDAWARLEEEGLILLRAGGRARFVQPMMQETAYGMLLQSRRQQLHGLAAQALAAPAQSGPGRAEARRVHAQAWHLERAGERARAARLWVEAAETARAVDAAAEALDLFDRALRADPTLADEVDGRRGPLLARLGRLQEGILTLDNLVTRLRASGAQREASLALSRRAYLAYMAGDGPGILSFSAQGLAIAEALGDPLPLTAALRVSGVGAEFCGRYAEARATYQRLLDISVRHDDPEILNNAGHVHNSLGEIARMEGHYEEALASYDRFLERRRAASPQLARRLWNLNTGAAYIGLERWREALARLSFAIDEATRARDHAVLPEGLVYLALAEAGLGRAEDALGSAWQAHQEAERQGQVEMMGLALRVIGLLEAEAGDLDAGQRALRESVAGLEAAGKPVEEARSRIALAAVLERGGVPGASEEREQAAGLLHGSGLAFDPEALRRAPERWMALAVAPRR